MGKFDGGRKLCQSSVPTLKHLKPYIVESNPERGLEDARDQELYAEKREPLWAPNERQELTRFAPSASCQAEKDFSVCEARATQLDANLLSHEKLSECQKEKLQEKEPKLSVWRTFLKFN